MRERVNVRVRSSQDPMAAYLSLEGRAATVVLDDGEFGVAPGQACVFYSSDTAARVLGGGWIASTSSDIDEMDFSAVRRTADDAAAVREFIAPGPGE